MQQLYSRRVVLKLWATLALFLAFCLLFLYVCTDLFHPASMHPTIPTDVLPAAPTRLIVVLDAGHGGYDSGTRSSSGVLEKDLNLAITKKIAAQLTLFDIDVVLTRKDDTPPSLDERGTRKQNELLSRARTAAEHNASLFLSIHMNSFPQASCHGAQVFFTERNLQNEVFACTLQEAIQTLVQSDNQRVAKNTNQIFLLNHLECPSALLECGFLSNDAETRLLCDEEYQSKLAFSITCAIVQYLSAT